MKLLPEAGMKFYNCMLLKHMGN